MLFKDLNLTEPILKALEKEGYKEPTPIQQQAIPVVLAKRDLIGCAQTGTGKTAAFAIPILQNLDQLLQKPGPKGKRRIKTLILTPTRELAIQIGESMEAYGSFTRVRHTVIFGGVSQRPQVSAIRAGVDILVATPGRLLDLVNQKFISLRNISTFVLDEADRMLDMGFIHDMKKIIALLPEKKQTLLFSATMPKEIAGLADSLLVQPEKVAVAPISSTAERIDQSVYFVAKADKKRLLKHILQDETIDSVLVFTRTKHGANKVVKDLGKAGIQAEAIHGNKSQSARQRALRNFKSRETRVLVATDIAARGIDVDELSHVINYDLPNEPETYVHRIGRTGRAGLSGIALSFCDSEEKGYLKNIRRLTKCSIETITGHPYLLSDSAENNDGDTAGPERQNKSKKSASFHRKRRRSGWKKPNKEGNRPARSRG